MLISKLPKSIAGRTKCPRWQHAACVFETPAFILDIYLQQLNTHCVGSTTIMWSVKVFIIYFTLTFRREKNSFVKQSQSDLYIA